MKHNEDLINSEMAAEENKGEPMKSILIKDTTKRRKRSDNPCVLDCGGGCENCSSCWLGRNPWDIYQDYIDGNREIKDINMGYMKNTVRTDRYYEWSRKYRRIFCRGT